MKKLYFLLFTLLIAAASFGQSVFINEIHYDDASTDSGEGVEIAGPAGTDLSTYTIIAYNGSSTSGAPYSTTNLTGTIDDEGSGYGAVWFPIVGLQNGAPDGISLDNGGTLVQFLSYEGTFTGVGGPADSVLSTDIGVSETGTVEGSSLQLTGAGLTYNNFSWATEATATPGTINTGQTFGTPVPTIALFDGPASGSTIDVSPEELSGDLEFVVTNFNVDTQANGGDGYYEWIILNTTTATEHDASGPLYDLNPVPFTPLEPNNSYFLVAQLFSYTTPGVIAEYDLNANALGYTDVSSVADLRAVTDNGYYRLTTEAFLTFQQSFRGQKFIQDASGGILIDDNNGVISTTYAVNDGITNIRGQVSEFAGMKQLVPSADYGAPTSSANIITPQAVTLADLTSNAEQYESELVEVTAVTLDNSINTTFVNGAEYVMSQSTDNFNFRATFFGVDYITANVPTVATDIVGIVNERSGNLYFLTARNANDFSVDVLSNDTFKENTFKIYPNPTSLGYINISSKSQTAMNVGVYDILGKQVINQTVKNNRLDVSNLNTGIYIMKISQDDATTTKKLIIN